MTSIAERHKYILESLAKNGFIKVNEICLLYTSDAADE